VPVVEYVGGSLHGRREVTNRLDPARYVARAVRLVPLGVEYSLTEIPATSFEHFSRERYDRTDRLFCDTITRELGAFYDYVGTE
jgi:hypothetical protein